MKKKLLSALLILVMLLCVGCSVKEEAPADSAPAPAETEVQEPEPSAEPEPSEEPGPSEVSEADGYVYESTTYGFSITMPEEWRESCIITEENGFVRFINTDNQFLSYGDVEYEAGVLFTLTVGSDEMKQGDGTYLYPSYDVLGKIGGEDFLAIYPTDVQYNTEDEALQQAYRAMEDQIESVLATIIFG